MPDSPRPNYGRLATLLVLGALVLTVCAAVYVFVGHHGTQPASDSAVLTQPELEQQSGAARRLATMLTIALISALLILLFAIGAYLVIRAGQFVARGHVGGKPTAYVDAWSQYRLSDEQISAATDEERPGGADDGEPDGPSPQPPTGPDGSAGS